MRARTTALFAILAVAALVAGCTGSSASPGAAATPSPAAPSATSAFHLEKDCAGYDCTVTSSSWAAIPVGTTISYSSGSGDSLTSTITVGADTAVGQCNLSGGLGTCVFTGGTGSLAGFELTLNVKQAGATWTWDSTTAPQ